LEIALAPYWIGSTVIKFQPDIHPPGRLAFRKEHVPWHRSGSLSRVPRLEDFSGPSAWLSRLSGCVSNGIEIVWP
jgi:hypothetical protein